MNKQPERQEPFRSRVYTDRYKAKRREQERERHHEKAGEDNAMEGDG